MEANTKQVVRQLCRLNSRAVLIEAALDGLITQVRCEMPICHCPHGREHFDVAEGAPWSTPWRTSPDRFPTPPARADSTYLATFECHT